MEIWKDIAGYENSYQVSNSGRVKSLPKQTYGQHITSTRILKPQKQANGYRTVTLYKNRKPKTFGVHRLVATAFIPNPQAKPEVDHIDGNPQNNTATNLRWATRSENESNEITRKRISAWQKGGKCPSCGKFGRKHHNSKPVERVDGSGHTKKYECVAETERDGFDYQEVSKCCRGLRESYKGYHWRFL